MSLKSREARVLAKAGTAALIIAGVAGVPVAQAANVPDVTLEYTCKYPIVDKQPLSIKVSSNIPTEAVVRVQQPAFKINAVATAGGDTARAINTLNAYSIEGSSEAFADLEFPDGFIQEDLFVPLTVAKWTRPSSDPVAGDLVLTASGDTPSIQLEPVGNATIRLDRITLNLMAKGQSGNIINVRKLTTDFDGVAVPVDTTPDDFNVYCKLNAGQSNVIATIKVVDGTTPVNNAPSQVTGLASPTKGETTVNLAWNAATDPDAGDSVKEYKVYQGATLVKTVAAPATTTQITGLTASTGYSFSVEAVDTKGLAGARSAALPVTTNGPVVGPNTAPTVPTGLKVGTVTSSSIALSWTASTDNVKVAGYNIYRNGTKVGTSATPSYTATGLTASTTYQFTVDAFDEPGLTSAKTAAVPGTTGPAVVVGPCPEGFACQGYTLAGSTTLKTLTTGVLPLKGGIDAQLDPSNGKFTADLVLNPTTGRLTAGGFLPVTVKIGFAPSGKTVGTLDDNNILRSKSLVRIKVSEVKLFGAIPLAGGNSCQTKSLSEINLTSTKAFEIFKGGTLTGTYAISDLNGCGILNGIVSPLTAGGGNTISLNLTPKA